MATSVSIEVDRPAADVFAYVTDPSRFPEWQNGVVDGRRQGDGPESVGDKCVNTRKIGFAKRSVTSDHRRHLSMAPMPSHLPTWRGSAPWSRLGSEGL